MRSSCASKRPRRDSERYAWIRVGMRQLLVGDANASLARIADTKHALKRAELKGRRFVQHQRKSMLARTKNGQPVLKNMMANLLSKLAK